MVDREREGDSEELAMETVTQEVRLELDRIAHIITAALASFDTDPDPEKLDGRLNGPCRICRLLWDRSRAIASFVERDPEMLDAATTQDVLKNFLGDLEGHKRTTKANSIKLHPTDPEKQVSHDPMMNYMKAMIDSVRSK